MDSYESETLLSQYLLFHYGGREENLPWPSGPADGLDYPRRTVSEFLATLDLEEVASALDVGCAVGRSAFELTRYAQSVTAVDYSQAFINAASQLQAGGSLPYRIHEEGGIFSDAVARVPADLVRDRVQFEVGDAMALRPELRSFDIVHASNLIDRLHTPMAFLERCPDLVASGGYLIITSPFTWLEEFTPREHWLGGPGSTETQEKLKNILSENFILLEQLDLPFLIREHRRKFQWSMAFAGLWQRR